MRAANVLVQSEIILIALFCEFVASRGKKRQTGKTAAVSRAVQSVLDARRRSVRMQRHAQ
jgi:hypothetical protein